MLHRVVHQDGEINRGLQETWGLCNFNHAMKQLYSYKIFPSEHYYCHVMIFLRGLLQV